MSPAPNRRLVVCVKNANRSQTAQAFARMHGGDAVEQQVKTVLDQLLQRPTAADA